MQHPQKEKRVLREMANSKYEYVKEFEMEDGLLKNTWVVVRVDGRGFHKYVSFLIRFVWFCCVSGGFSF